MSRLFVPALLLGGTLSLAPGHSLGAQVGSPAGPVPVANLTARRNALLARMGTGVAVLRSAEERDIESDYPQDSDFRQDNDFFYLTGLETPGSWLVVQARDSAPPRVILYLPARDTAQERWTGPKLGPGPEATAITGIDDVRPADKAEAEIRGFAYTSGRRDACSSSATGRWRISTCAAWPSMALPSRSRTCGRCWPRSAWSRTTTRSAGCAARP